MNYSGFLELMRHLRPHVWLETLFPTGVDLECLSYFSRFAYKSVSVAGFLNMRLALNPADETPHIQQTDRIQLGFDCFHQFKATTDWTPNINLTFEGSWCGLND